MRLEDMRAQVHAGIDRRCAGLCADPRRVERVLNMAHEEDVKRKTAVAFRPARRVVLVLAVMLAMTCAALAAFHSQLAELFGKQYGGEMQAWLEQGDIALPDHCVRVEGVTFALDEVVYRNLGLYALMRVTPGEGIVLLGEDGDVNDAYGYDKLAGERAPQGSITIAEKAAQEGSAIKRVSCYLDRIGVNDGALLVPDSFGYSVHPQRDGSIRILFEVADGASIAKGESYTLQMTAFVHDVSAEGVVDWEHEVRHQWTVKIEPKPIAEGTAAAQPPATPAPAVSHDHAGMQVIVPEAYTASGTLPVYAARARDFSRSLDYTWFNQSGVAAETPDARVGGVVDFADGGQLHWESDNLYYDTYDGTYETVAEHADGTTATYTLPKRTMASAVGDLAWWAVWAAPVTGKTYALKQTQLGRISLEKAQAQAEGLMAGLGMSGYTCTAALDMGVARIREIGALWEEAIESGALTTNAYRYDFGAATADDEGYLLSYHKFGDDGDFSSRFQAVFYVTAEGIAFCQLRDAYEQGDVLYTPEKLVDAQSVAAALPGELAGSRFPEALERITRARLTWMPVRADEGEGMVLTPVWVLSYLTGEDARRGYESWAVFSAIDGTLIDAAFI